MKITHTWENQEGIQMAWATPAQREISACQKDGGDDVLEYCKAPRGWDFAEDDDTSDDGGNPGRYLIRA